MMYEPERRQYLVNINDMLNCPFRAMSGSTITKTRDVGGVKFASLASIKDVEKAENL